MSDVYLCRVGRHSQIGKFRNPESVARLRGQDVVLRTARGIEIGQILNQVSIAANDSDIDSKVAVDATDGKILRSVTPEERLLQQQLLKAANTAFESCQQLLREIGNRDCLLEVEPLLDGRTLYFHFIGTPDDSLTTHLHSLVEIFRETVQESQFAKLLEEGCGPGCGTKEKASCGDSGTCTVCVIAKACKS